jgi:hypothetical protein
MKTLLFLLLFIVVMPLLIGRLAGLSSKSKNDLTPLATIAGLLILFSLYLVFIDDNKKKPKDKQTQQSSSSSAQSAQPNNCNVTCIHDDYSIYKEERREQYMSGRTVEVCDPPAIEYQRHEDAYGSY